MITATTRAASVKLLGRLDAWYYLAPGADASRQLTKAKKQGVGVVPLGGPNGLGSVWQPSRFKRVYAGRGESSVPYLTPHDAFQYLPDEIQRLSLTRTKDLKRYRISRGQILQTCSGRNLGPNVLVDKYLARFAVSHDVARIDIDDERMRCYAAAFLRSPIGQDLLRRDKGGSVIDHISVGHIEAQEIPILDEAVIDGAAAHIRRSFGLVEKARLALAKALATVENSLPSLQRDALPKSGWTINARELRGRLDAVPYDPWIHRVRQELLAEGGVPLHEVADVVKPPGRYKTIYVDQEYGRPFMSGAQILQLVPAKRQFMSERAFSDVALYELRNGWSVYMADGRAERNLGVVAMVPRDREGWLASGHVGRLVPHSGTDPGWLWLAARTQHVQLQIKAMASGSVVDSTYPTDMANVILPPDTGIAGSEITKAWEQFARARNAEAKAIALVSDALQAASRD